MSPNPPGSNYPPSPAGVDDKVLQPSSAFKRDVFKVMGSILFFILTYLVLVAAACVLAALCAYGGIALVFALPKFFTLMIGLGLVGVGLMVLFFLLKFIFKRTKTDRSQMLEIKESDQPELFAFIRRLTKDTRTPFPKKIYLSQEVNASVFYDSGFWSMFFPVKKNLNIGLGLVNSLNLSEFKAVLAHEFGHFSQRSMKLGSYTYNVNKIIYDMLYENEGYGRTLQRWASASGYFAFFANITVAIVEGIQSILRKVYAVVNKSYMSLSRQMEFHADSVSAYVSGSMSLVTSLNRLEASDLCYNNLFSHYNSWLADAYKPDNVYPQHTEIMKHFGEYHKIPLEYGLLKIDQDSFAGAPKSRLVIKNQWASHPSTDEREKHLRSLNIPAEVYHDSAWTIFRNIEELQKRMTEKIYEKVKFEKPPVILDYAAFTRKYSKGIEEDSLDKAYQGYYDNRHVSVFSVSEILAESNTGLTSSFDELINDSNSSLPASVPVIENDIQILEAIVKGDFKIKSFDFDGTKYESYRAATVKAKLEEELTFIKKKIEELDKQVFLFFYTKAKLSGKEKELAYTYENLFILVRESESDLKLYQALAAEVQPIFNVMPFDKIKEAVTQIGIKEIPVKDRIKQILSHESSASILTDEQKTKLENFISGKWYYFHESSYNNPAVELLTESMSIFYYLINEKVFRAKKKMLQSQLQLLN